MSRTCRRLAGAALALMLWVAPVRKRAVLVIWGAACMVALLLLLAATCSVCFSLHQSLHRSEAPAQHFCLACSLAKGQIIMPETAVFLLLAFLAFAFCLRLGDACVTSPLDLRLSHSRAPPRR